MRHSKWVALLVLLVSALACGGGGGSAAPVGGSPSPVVASFTPDVANPVPGTVALLQGSKTSDMVVLRVTATDVQATQGTEFELVYDETKVEYDDSPSTPGWSAGTVYEQGGVTPIRQVAMPVAGRLIVAVSRPGSAGTVNVTGTQTIIQLRFRALTTGSSRLDFQNMNMYASGVPPTTIGGIAWKGGSVIGS